MYISAGQHDIKGPSEVAENHESGIQEFPARLIVQRPIETSNMARSCEP